MPNQSPVTKSTKNMRTLRQSLSHFWTDNPATLHSATAAMFVLRCTFISAQVPAGVATCSHLAAGADTICRPVRWWPVTLSPVTRHPVYFPLVSLSGSDPPRNHGLIRFGGDRSLILSIKWTVVALGGFTGCNPELRDDEVLYPESAVEHF
jgi:hypothetical protein